MLVVVTVSSMFTTVLPISKCLCIFCSASSKTPLTFRSCRFAEELHTNKNHLLLSKAEFMGVWGRVMCELDPKSLIWTHTIKCAQRTQGLPVVGLNCALGNCLQVSSTVYTELHIPPQFPKPFHTPLFCLEKALTLATRAPCVRERVCVCVCECRMLLATCLVPSHSPTERSFICRD